LSTVFINSVQGSTKNYRTRGNYEEFDFTYRGLTESKVDDLKSFLNQDDVLWSTKKFYLAYYHDGEFRRIKVKYMGNELSTSQLGVNDDGDKVYEMSLRLREVS